MFGNASLQEISGELRLGQYTARRQDISVAQLVIRGAKITNFYLTSFHQPLEAIVDDPETNAQSSRQLALRQLWVCVQSAHHSKAGILVN